MCFAHENPEARHVARAQLQTIRGDRTLGCAASAVIAEGEVLRAGRDSAVARIIGLVEQAQARIAGGREHLVPVRQRLEERRDPLGTGGHVDRTEGECRHADESRPD